MRIEKHIHIRHSAGKEQTAKGNVDSDLSISNQAT